MTKRPGNPQQRQAVKDLRALAEASPEHVRNVGSAFLVKQTLVVPVTLSMRELDHPGTHLDLHDEETFLVGFPPVFPMRHPTVEVDHERWLGAVHILANAEYPGAFLRLCIYRDVGREWHPSLGVQGVLHSIWTLLDDIANNRVDRAAAQFHALGGLQPHIPDAPKAVVRESLGDLSKPLGIASIRRRSPHRIDLLPRDPDAERVLTIAVPAALLRGPGQTLGQLLSLVESAGGAGGHAVVEALKRTASHNGASSALTFILAVSRVAAGAGEGHHIAVGELDPSVAAGLAGDDVQATRTLARVAPITWYDTADQRREAAMRRDATRPTVRLEDLTVELLGCGALGSWIAEYLARAGIAAITLRDPATIGPDLLIRQNYREDDVGDHKVERLRSRLEAISDGIHVRTTTGPAEGADIDQLLSADLVIDATASETVGAWLDAVATSVPAHPLMAAVSLDAPTATLGLVSVAASSEGRGPAAIDELAHTGVLARSDLEAFHSFWRDPEPGDEVTPMPGCSSPTFHGSAADVAGLAAAMVTAISQHQGGSTSGLHLLATPSSAHRGSAGTFLPTGG